MVFAFGHGGWLILGCWSFGYTVIEPFLNTNCVFSKKNSVRKRGSKVTDELDRMGWSFNTQCSFWMKHAPLSRFSFLGSC